MLEHRGIDHKVVEVIPGTHAVAVRALGFQRGTVPALRLDGRKIQVSRGRKPPPPTASRRPSGRKDDLQGFMAVVHAVG
ncbi:MAG TPA: glutathione S-transferase N-terminal domain-containing protein, partial [Solirubrobacterales bacterium]|nr:glutathione S-transferase N-terminal domain-containing protein [Solirubrobacterales bacterium]